MDRYSFIEVLTIVLKVSTFLRCIKNGWLTSVLFKNLLTEAGGPLTLINSYHKNKYNKLQLQLFKFTLGCDMFLRT